MAEDNVFVRQNYGKRLGFGASPAFLIVDFVNGFKDPALFGSTEIAKAMSCTRTLLDVARAAGIPVVYTRHLFAEDGSDLGLFARKVPAQAVLTEDHPSSQIVDELAPRPGEIIIHKRYPSAFFSTDLAALLHLRGIDTAIIAGCSSSGCVHATAVDAMGHGFRPMVVRECVGDRHAPSHDAALLNINMKYGDVIELKEAIRYVEATAASSLGRTA